LLSPGHGPLVPVQNSTASHVSVAERQTVVLGDKTSPGQREFVPSHVS